MADRLANDRVVHDGRQLLDVGQQRVVKQSGVAIVQSAEIRVLVQRVVEAAQYVQYLQALGVQRCGVILEELEGTRPRRLRRSRSSKLYPLPLLRCGSSSTSRPLLLVNSTGMGGGAPPVRESLVVVDMDGAGGGSARMDWRRLVVSVSVLPT